MAEVRVSIGRVKRDLSELLNRVAYGGERVVLTSRGKAKAVLISVDDYDRLKNQTSDGSSWRAWLAESERLSSDIQRRRGGQPLDLDGIWTQARAELEERDGRLGGD
ncbi:MAG: type II toxin-antitoxin system Phd/YefM family antitoxin [Anaerolineae bacterium]|nr:type II toxin-antitoxin system Phd/YefM family antitoxin [Anaerolineae bacterium]